jgi:hypothetical protein
MSAKRLYMIWRAVILNDLGQKHSQNCVSWLLSLRAHRSLSAAASVVAVPVEFQFGTRVGQLELCRLFTRVTKYKGRKSRL